MQVVMNNIVCLKVSVDGLAWLGLVISTNFALLLYR